MATSNAPELRVAADSALRPSPVPVAEGLEKVLKGARTLLVYAARAGIEVPDDIRRTLLEASATPEGEMTSALALQALSAVTLLEASLKPVTAESLSACEDRASVNKTVRSYRNTAVWLAVVIIPMSLVTFVTTSLSEATLKDIDVANALAVKLSDELAPGAQQNIPRNANADQQLPRGVSQLDVIRDLQALAATTRSIDARARQMTWFTFGMVEDPLKRIRNEGRTTTFELSADLPNLSQALTERIAIYQQVRYFAQSAREWIATVYGAIVVGVLPVLYALLGACAYLLRLYQDQLRQHTFTGADSHVSRFLIAAIGGGVVGLFKDFALGDGASISPLAIAFLVGYGADVFFSFLDSFVQTFNRGSGATVKH